MCQRVNMTIVHAPNVNQCRDDDKVFLFSDDRDKIVVYVTHL